MVHYHIGVVLLVLLLLASVFSTQAMAGIQLPIADAMAEAAAQSRDGNQSEAQTIAENARQQWEQHRVFTASFADHQPLEDIECLFARLPDTDETEYPALCAELSRKIRAVAEAHALSLGSFF